VREAVCWARKRRLGNNRKGGPADKPVAKSGRPRKGECEKKRLAKVSPGKCTATDGQKGQGEERPKAITGRGGSPIRKKTASKKAESRKKKQTGSTGTPHANSQEHTSKRTQRNKDTRENGWVVTEKKLHRSPTAQTGGKKNQQGQGRFMGFGPLRERRGQREPR